MSMVAFKKGLLANLPATKTAGTFYVTTDERAMYLDVDESTRIRLGDFQEFANTTALMVNPNPSTTALYYVSDINCLAKYDGTQYIQINQDTGMTSVEVSGEGNAITAAVYDATGRKLTLTKGATYMTSADVDSKISDKVGTLKIGDTSYDNVTAYVDAKTAGIATDAQLENLTTEVNSLKSKVDTDGTVSEAISASASATKTAILGQTDEGVDYVGTVKGAYEAAKAAQDTADTKTTMAEVEAKGYAVESEVNAALDTKVDKVEGKSLISDTEIERLASVDNYDDTEIKQSIADNASAIDLLNGDETTEGSVKKAVKDAQTTLETAIGKKVDQTVYDAKVSTLESADTTLQANINAEITRAKAAEQTNATAIAEVKSDVDAFFDAAEVGEAAVDTLKEIQAYITSDGSAAAEMTSKISTLETTVGKAADGENEATGLVKSVADNASAISAEEARAKAAEEANAAAIDALETAVGDSTSGLVKDVADNASAIATEKSRAEGAESALSDRIEDLEAIDHDAYALKTEVASSQYDQDTKINANTSAIETLNGADTVAGSVAKQIKDAIDAENLSQYATDTELSALDTRVQAVEGTSHTHANKDELDKIASGDKAKWDAVVTDHLVAADKTELENAIALKANSDDVYTKTQTYTQDEVNALLSWIDF